MSILFAKQLIFLETDDSSLFTCALWSCKLTDHQWPLTWILSLADWRTCSLFNGVEGGGVQNYSGFQFFFWQDISHYYYWGCQVIVRPNPGCSLRLLCVGGWWVPFSFWSSVIAQLYWTGWVSEVLIHITCLTGCNSHDSWFSKQWVVSLSAFHWCKLSFNSPVPQLGERVHQLSRVVRSQR